MTNAFQPLETICILGPTCSWKSEVALVLAKEIGGEIISCDSMQIYRGIPIGTAQPPPEDLAQVRHHLVNCLDISEPYDANRFVIRAENILQQLDAEKKPAIIVGGTGLYARSLAYNLTLLPSDLQLSLQLRQRMEQPNEAEAMLQDLTEYCRQHQLEIPLEIKQNPRRLLRAYEVWSLTGKVPWELAQKPTAPRPRYRQFCLLPDWDMLRQRIRLRSHKMLEAGWEQEALEAEKNGLLTTPTARQALGYQDICQFNHQGRPGGTAALEELLGNRTIQYARRQMTWFKHQHPGAVQLTIDCQDESPVASILAKIHNILKE